MQTIYRKSPVFAVILFTLVAISPLFAQDTAPADPAARETIFVDDNNYQEFRGKIGKWVMPTRTKGLAAYIQLFESTPEEVAEVNKGFPAGFKYAFIPYGKTYIERLEQSGIKRASTVSASDQFVWPICDRITISSVLGFRWREFHCGVDIPAERGAVVRAAMEGQVLDVRFEGGYGNVVDIQHRNDLMTRYGHNTVILVAKGDFVKKGQIIALAGSTGRSTGSHVHFEIRCNSIPLDPMDFLPDSDKVPSVQNMKSWKLRKK